VSLLTKKVNLIIIQLAARRKHWSKPKTPDARNAPEEPGHYSRKEKEEKRISYHIPQIEGLYGNIRSESGWNARIHCLLIIPGPKKSGPGIFRRYASQGWDTMYAKRFFAGNCTAPDARTQWNDTAWGIHQKPYFHRTAVWAPFPAGTGNPPVGLPEQSQNYRR